MFHELLGDAPQLSQTWRCFRVVPSMAAGVRRAAEEQAGMGNARLPQRAGLGMTCAFKYAPLVLALATRR